MSVVVEEKSQHLKFTYGEDVIPFERVKRRGTAEKVTIRVHPDARVVVSAPENTSDAHVLTAVQKRARWIYLQRKAFDAFASRVSPRQYISGESHYYLGKQYVLKVLEDTAQPQGVKLLRGRLEVMVRKKTAEQVQKLLDDWYKIRAKEVFSVRLQAVIHSALWVNELPPIRLLNMKTQWGSCSPSGLITLNPKLVKAPRECIDYVILHELCHLAEHNHSKHFYRLMHQVMPGWEKIKSRLDNMASIINT